MPADRTVHLKQSANALTITRQFDAPASHLWRAHTDPEVFTRWMLGPPGWTMSDCRIDTEIGGAYGCTWSNPEQPSFTIGGRMLDLVPNQRLVQTEKFSGIDMGGETIVVTLFNEEAGVTTMRIATIYETSETLEKAVDTGMCEGMSATYDSLDKILSQLS